MRGGLRSFSPRRLYDHRLTAARATAEVLLAADNPSRATARFLILLGSELDEASAASAPVNGGLRPLERKSAARKG